jgi:hypothetical protein
VAAAQTARCVISITANRQCAVLQWFNPGQQGEGIMAGIRTYEGWWDTSPFDERSERALLSAFIATIASWGTAFLLALG